MTDTSLGLPSVSVPVLSTTSVSTFSSTSSASAFLTSTPGGRAAAGADHDRHRRRQAQRARAGDDQHRDGVDDGVGHRAACGPNSAQTMKVIDGDDHDRRNEIAGDRVGQPLDRRTAALGLADHPHDLGQQRFAADALGPHHEAAGAVDVPPITRSPAAFSTGIGSPVTIDSSTALAPSSTTPSTGTFSPGRTRSRSPTWT